MLKVHFIFSKSWDYCNILLTNSRAEIKKSIIKANQCAISNVCFLPRLS